MDIQCAATDARLIAPCCLLVGSVFFPKDKHDASKALDRAQRVYSEINDELELTTCDIKRGDWHVTSAGPPEVWNSFLKEGIEGYALSADLQSSEFCVDIDNTDTAREYHEKAMTSYEKHDCLRGQASVYLQLAYLETLRTVKTMNEAHSQATA